MVGNKLLNHYKAAPLIGLFDLKKISVITFAFLTWITHEFNKNLNVIQGSKQNLLTASLQRILLINYDQDTPLISSLTHLEFSYQKH